MMLNPNNATAIGLVNIPNAINIGNANSAAVPKYAAISHGKNGTMYSYSNK